MQRVARLRRMPRMAVLVVKSMRPVALTCVAMIITWTAGRGVAAPPTTAPTTAPASQPVVYRAVRVEAPPAIDGMLDDRAWSEAPWTEEFVDLAGRPDHAPPSRTRAKLCWDETHLYVAAELSESDVWGHLTEHDAALFREDAFELFIDPDGDGADYVELQINARNTTWDLKMSRPYRKKGRADSAFEIDGLKSAVAVDGTLNEPADLDRGWTVELAIPWTSLAALSEKAGAVSPASMQTLRMNLVRVDWPLGSPGGVAKETTDKAEYWAWSPAGERNTHRPDTWGQVAFSAGRGAADGAARR